jgi:hypothetical protein
MDLTLALITFLDLLTSVEKFLSVLSDRVILGIIFRWATCTRGRVPGYGCG